MIKRLAIENIQSHEKSEFKFVRGINCIIGSSDNGKSAALRAMFWAIRNRQPNGQTGDASLVSHWARNDKGKICKDVFVEIENDRGIVSRNKTGNENFYAISLIGVNNSELRKLEAIRSDVPEEVERFFNLSETNIQQQQDPPFLLSASSADVARFFNRIVRLDIIDRVLGNAESNRRKNKQEAEALQKTLTTQKAQDEKFNWIEIIEPILEKIERVEKRVKKFEDSSEKLTAEIEQMETLLESQIAPALLHKANGIIFEIEAIEKSLKKLNTDFNDLEESIDEYRKNKKIKDKAKPCAEAKILIEKIEKLNTGLNPLRLTQQKINTSIVSYSDEMREKKEAEKTANEHRELLPDTCPLCGEKMDGDTCYNTTGE